MIDNISHPLSRILIDSHVLKLTQFEMDAPEKGGTLRIYTRCQRKAQQLRNERLALQLSNSLEPCVEGDLRVKISSETCFHLMLKPGVSTESFWERHNGKLSWLLSHHVFSPEDSDVTTQSRLRKNASSCIMVEVNGKLSGLLSTNYLSIYSDRAKAADDHSILDEFHIHSARDGHR